MIIFALLIAYGGALRLQNPQTQVFKDDIEPEEYSTVDSQIIELTYHKYQGVYAMSLKEVKNGTYGQELTLKQNETEMVNESWEQINPIAVNGCHTVKRSLKVDKLGEYDEIQDAQTLEKFTVYQDFAYNSKMNTLYIVRSDLSLIQLKIQGKDISKSSIQNVYQLKDYVEASNSSMINPDLQIICAQNDFCYIFSDQRIVFFQVANNLTFQSIPLQNTQTINYIHYNSRQSAIYAAMGSLGVDVYAILDNGQLKHVHRIGPKDFSLSQINLDIRDVNTDEEGKFLYVLDGNIGLYVFEIMEINRYVRKPFIVEVKRARAFDHYGQTFFIIASTNSLRDYALEVFLDSTKGDYYLNRIYLQSMQLFDVVVTEHWAILVGFDAHRVVYHSVYKEFLGDFEDLAYIEDPDLIKVIVIQKNITFQEESTQLFGLSNDDIRVFDVSTRNPYVSCQSMGAINKEYVLTMNSTQCYRKLFANEKSQFAQCQVEHKFRFISSGVILSKDQVNIVMYVFIGIGSFIFLMLIICLLCWKRWSKHLSELESKSKRLKQELKYQEFSDQAMVGEINELV